MQRTSMYMRLAITTWADSQDVPTLKAICFESTLNLLWQGGDWSLVAIRNYLLYALMLYPASIVLALFAAFARTVRDHGLHDALATAKWTVTHPRWTRLSCAVGTRRDDQSNTPHETQTQYSE